MLSRFTRAVFFDCSLRSLRIAPGGRLLCRRSADEKRVGSLLRSTAARDPRSDTISPLGWTFGVSCQNTRGAPIDIRWALHALDPPGQSERLFVTPPSKLPSKLRTTARAMAASTSRARQESVPIKKAPSAKKSPAKKAPLKSVDSASAAKATATPPVAADEVV